MGLNQFFLILVAFCSSVLLTPLVRNVALGLGIVDRPDKRKIHKSPVPRVGGLSVIASVMLTLVAAQHFQWMSEEAGVWPSPALLWGAGLVVFIGLYDERAQKLIADSNQKADENRAPPRRRTTEAKSQDIRPAC